MANIKSAKKRIKTNLRNKNRNRAYKSQLKTAIHNLTVAIKDKSNNQLDLLKGFIKLVDKLAQKRIVHRNFSSRVKSKYTKLCNETL